jgi:uncharacterized repeat protein (TIGR04076 family)
MKVNPALWDKMKWRLIKRRLGYDKEQMESFRNDARNEKVLSAVPTLLSKTLVAEVVDAHGCNSQHQVGDKFYFDGAGNLLTRRGPKKICVHALSAISPLVFAANELVFAGVDPNEMCFKRAACTADVGLACGGWGRVVVELRAQERSHQDVGG